MDAVVFNALRAYLLLVMNLKSSAIVDPAHDCLQLTHFVVCLGQLIDVG